MTQTMPIIDLQQTVNDIVRRHPATLPIFNAFGIDSCCGGALPLATIAARHGIALDVLSGALESALSRATEPA
jgi:iron-sulfur cluster repair protein YtfE (RIC family)